MKYRYALRNKHKIIQHYNPGGDKILQRIILSLDNYFQKEVPEPYKLIEDEKYPLLLIDDQGHTCALIVFYVIDIKFNVYRLAFKEFIG